MSPRYLRARRRRAIARATIWTLDIAALGLITLFLWLLVTG